METHEDLGHIIRIAVLNIDQLPESFKALISSKQDDLQKALIKLAHSENRATRIRSLDALSKLERKIDTHFVLHILGELLLDEDEEIRSKAENLKSSIGKPIS